MTENEAPVRKSPRPAQRHLMTPGSPRPQNQDPMSLGRVQRLVLSTLAAVTIVHMSAGLVVAAVFMEKSRLDSRIGLLVIAGAFGVIAVVAALIIHKKRLLSPLLLLGLLPAAVGAYLTFWR